MMSMNRSRYASQYRQGGAFSIMAAGTLALALLCLVLVVDSGRLYMEQRSLQRVADMAALEAVSRGGVCRDADGTSTAFGFAEDATKRNKLNEDNLSSVTCVNLITNTDGVRVLDPINPFNESSQIIQVIVEKTTPASLVIQAGCLFTSCENEVTLQATAVAGREEPIAAFSVGSRLLRFDNESVLGGVLGLIGVDLGADIGSYKGLANVDITPDGLLKELGLPITADLTVGGLNDLLAAREVNVLELIEATATVVGKSELLNLGLDILDTVKSNVGIENLNLTFPLLTQPDGTPGLFAEIIAPNTQSASAALNTQLSALGILETAIGIATHEHALSVDKLNINLLGLVKVTTQVGVVEPPSIAVGAPTRRDANGNIVQEGAKAYTAQVRAYIRVQTGELITAVNSLTSLLGINLIYIDLPIALDLVSGRGVLEENTCTPIAAQRGAEKTGNPEQDYAEIAVSGEVAGLCIGLPRDEHQLFSRYESCESYMQGTKYLDILGLLKLDKSEGSPLTLPALKIPKKDVYLSLDHTDLPPDWSDMHGRADSDTVDNPLTLGTLVTDLINLLVGSGSGTVISSNTEVARNIWLGATDDKGCENTECRIKAMETVQVRAKAAEANADSVLSGLVGELLTGLVGGLVNLVGNLLSDVIELLANLAASLLSGTIPGNLCTTDSHRYPGLRMPPINQNDTTDQACIKQIENSLPSNTGADLGIGILTNLLNELGNKVLKPILKNLLGLHISEVDVHLQDLNCGHARLLQ